MAALVCCILQGRAVDNNTVEIVYSGTSATISIAPNITQYVSVSSGTSSHVIITQSSDFAGVDNTTDNEDGEIIYILSGSSTDGEFLLTGSYKCEVDLNGLTLTNPSGPALNIQNGKRIAISAKKGTSNTLTDGANDSYNGCIHVKGHTKIKGKGTLTVTGNSKHAIYSKEYFEMKNATLNITSAVKDAIHCKEYFLMESGTLTINSASEDGIQCELSTGSDVTVETTDHEDENSGNVYMTDGTMTISSVGGYAIKADGTASLTGGTRNFTDSSIYTSIAAPTAKTVAGAAQTFDLGGRRVGGTKGVVVAKGVKRLVKPASK